MAGAGFKTFNTGDVLTASDVNTYLMQQTVMVFASAAARTTALGANVAEGMISYLKDTNAVEVYDGSNWVSSDDPNAIQNTIVDAKGDLISATAADTPARLAVGSNNQVLVADSAQSTGLKWANVGMTLISTTTLSGASVTLSDIPQTYKSLKIILIGFTNNTADGNLTIRPNNSNNTFYISRITGSTVSTQYGGDLLFNNVLRTNASGNVELNIDRYTDTALAMKNAWGQGYFAATGTVTTANMYGGGVYTADAAVTSLVILNSGGTFSGGTAYLYGVN